MLPKFFCGRVPPLFHKEVLLSPRIWARRNNRACNTQPSLTLVFVNRARVSQCVIIYVCMYIYGLILYTPLEKIAIMGVKNLSQYIFLIFTVFAILPLVHTDVFAPQVCAKARNCLRLHEKFMQCVEIYVPLTFYSQNTSS